MPNGKIDAIGQQETSGTGKTFRRVTISGQDLSAFGYSEKNLSKFRVGDEVYYELSDNGKYLNKITRLAGGSPSSGGTPASSVPSGGGNNAIRQPSQADKDKEVGVLSRYTLDAYLSGKVKTIEEAIDLVFSIREEVVAKLAKSQKDEESDIRERSILTRLEKINPKLKDTHSVMLFIQKQMDSTEKFNRLVADLDSVIKGEKVLQLTPDGIPAFVYAS